MPSPIIIPSCARIVQAQIQPQIPQWWRGQFRFGVQALTLKVFVCRGGPFEVEGPAMMRKFLERERKKSFNAILIIPMSEHHRGC